jgi:transposase InsO family protein
MKYRCVHQHVEEYPIRSHQLLLAEHGIRSSMSGQGNCYDNACVESFFATLKRERVYRRHYPTRQQANLDLFKYMEVWQRKSTVWIRLDHRLRKVRRKHQNG